MQTGSDVFIGDTSRANGSFWVPATKRARHRSVSAGMARRAALPLAPAAGSAAFPFSLRWELGTQHSIRKTPNDSAIKAVLSVIFQEFQRPF